MFTTSLLRTVVLLLLSSATRNIFSIPVHGNYSDELTSVLASPQHEDYLDEVISTSTITLTSPVSEDFATELQNVPVCESADQWFECVVFLERHLNKSSKEYKQLRDIYDSYKGLPSSPLPIRAAINGYTELIQVLLNYGVPINKKYRTMEQTVLHLAAENRRNGLITFLLTQGADIQVKNYVGDTPLHAAVCTSESTAVSLLLDAGADVNVTNKDGETPLFKAVKYLSPPKYLFLRSKYRADLKNRKYVVGKKNIKLLLEHGADTNIPNNLGKTPLHVAAEVCNSTIVKQLIDGGANINAIDANYQTPLHIATESKNLSVVEYLVSMGCNKTITDVHGKTALDIADEKNFTEIVDLISKES